MMTNEDMKQTEAIGKPIVFEQGGRAFATSLDVAACFNKPHKTVLRGIRTLIERRPDLDGHNFVPIDCRDDGGRLKPSYNMDRDGFTLLAMGFTGQRALEFKLLYIDAFNRMEDALNASHVADVAEIPSQLREFPNWPLEELRTKKATADLYRMVYGPLSAQWIMPQLGFPSPPRDLVELGKQIGLALEGLPPHPQSVRTHSSG
jgi:Rha family phage regulatory protein